MPADHFRELLLTVILVGVIASLTAYYAHRQGRDPWLWMALGLLLGLIAPVILLFLSFSKQNEEQSKEVTRHVYEDPPLQLSQPPLIEEKENVLPFAEKYWYYLDETHQQRGPVEETVLKELWKGGNLSTQTYVWSSGMEAWQTVAQLTDLHKRLNE